MKAEDYPKIDVAEFSKVLHQVSHLYEILLLPICDGDYEMIKQSVELLEELFKAAGTDLFLQRGIMDALVADVDRIVEEMEKALNDDECDDEDEDECPSMEEFMREFWEDTNGNSGFSNQKFSGIRRNGKSRWSF